MCKKILAAILSICLLSSSFSIQCYAEPEPVIEEEEETSLSNNTFEPIDLPDFDIIAVKPKNIDNLVEQQKFRSKTHNGVPTGHGFAAEAGNTLYDQFTGKNVVNVGKDDKPKGPDRKIINRTGSDIFIQTKYYSNAIKSVDAGLKLLDDNKTYAWVYKEKGIPMQLEVPADQYDEAVEYLSGLIKDNRLKGITDPTEATNLIRKGHLTFDQAKNLAKPMTVESLSYDAVNGVITCTSAFGISFVCDFAVGMLNGYKTEDVLHSAFTEGANSAIISFSSHLISAQLLKNDDFLEVINRGSSEVIDYVGDKTEGEAVDFLLDATGQSLHPKALRKEPIKRYEVQKDRAAKVLNSYAVSNAISLTVITLPDAVDLFKNRVSPAQFSKNLIVNIAGATGDTAGAILGGRIAGSINPSLEIPGQIVGGLVLGGAAAYATDKIMDEFIEDDAVELYNMIEEAFNQKCIDYMVSNDEAEIVLEGIQSRLLQKDLYIFTENDFLKNLYQSETKEQDIEDFLEPLFVQATSNRPQFAEPSEEEIRDILLNDLGGEQALGIH